ncbi:MAG: prepilin peptidase [Acidobacteriota bacterium]
MLINPQITNIALALLLMLAVITDMKSRKIPNLLLGIGIVAAFAWNFYFQGLGGLLFSLKGFGVGIVLLVVPFILGGMGSGDVKLLGMIGAFRGSSYALSTFIWMALIGGVLAMFYLIKEGQLQTTFNRLGRGMVNAVKLQQTSAFLNSTNKKEFKIYFPYGVAIALGALAAHWKSW